MFRVLLFLLIFSVSYMSLSGQVKVILNDDNSFSLMRNGKPYYVKGVGGEVELEYAKKIGANSIRTWGIEHAQEVLDAAEKNGLTVMLGFWLQHERHGFDYNNKEKVQKQYEHFISVVDKFKDHPALLMWGIGNELDLQYSNPACWDAVQQIAAYIHKVDPNHPTSTVTAGLDSTELSEIMKRIPDMDIYCINTYGDIEYVHNNLRSFGWKGPYMITEWGPNGYWEVAKTSWDVSIEQTSREKKEVYKERYRQYIQDQPSCLGSYAFLWGSKQEYTETWFGLFSKDGRPTEPIDALEIAFLKSEKLISASPSIYSIKIDGKEAIDNVKLAPSQFYTATLDAAIAYTLEDKIPDEKNALKYDWKILAESTDKKSGGDKEKDADEIIVRMKNKSSNTLEFRSPTRPGAYRLMAYVSLNGKLAYANIPFYVDDMGDNGKQPLVRFKKTNMSDFE